MTEERAHPPAVDMDLIDPMTKERLFNNPHSAVGTRDGVSESRGWGLGSTSKNLPQTPEQIHANNEIRSKTKVYKTKKETASTEYISSLIARGMESLAESQTMGKINLADTNRLKEQTFIYLESCMEDGVLPDFQSFCLSLGYSRSGVSGYIKRNPESDPSCEWLIMCKDTFSALLSQAALGGDVNTIFAIFQEKAMYGWVEETKVTVQHEDALGAPKTEAELKAMNERYILDAVYEEVE